MQSSKTDHQNFSPFVVKTIRVQGNFGFYYEPACFDENHNVIIACPSNNTIQFYDATTFEPQGGREAMKLNGLVMQMSLQPGTDTYLLGCYSGMIYTYNLSKNEVKKLRFAGNAVRGIAFLDPNFYAFSVVDSEKLFLAALDNDESMLEFDMNSSPTSSLHFFSKRNLLFTSLENGLVRAYRTNKPPHLKAIYWLQTRELILNIQSIVNRDGKEYVLTLSADCTVKIWHIVKGRMGLLRVFRCECSPHSVVYLENYKMIAVSYQSNYVKFFRFPCMKLERTVYLSENDRHFLFLMKEKNMIGVTSYNKNLIEFIQLG